MYASLTLIVISLFTGLNCKILDEDMLLYWRRSGDPTKCKPFTSYFLNCNKCVCSADGTAYCTRMACFKKPADFLLIDESKELPANVEEDSRH